MKIRPSIVLSLVLSKIHNVMIVVILLVVTALYYETIVTHQSIKKEIQGSNEKCQRTTTKDVNANIAMNKQEVHMNQILTKFEDLIKENKGKEKVKTEIEEVQIKTETPQTRNNRLLHLRNFCQKRMDTIRIPNLSENLLYSDQQQVVYCSVPKVACTNWKRLLLYFDGKIKDPLNAKDKESVHFMPLKQLAAIHEVKARRRLAMYYTFLFVRNPFDRLLSAFRNKFHDPENNLFRHAHGINILKVSHPNVTTFTLEDTFKLTFDDFVTYVIDRHRKNLKMNTHWERMSLMCRLCSFKYDFIGKMDTLLEDSNTVLNDLAVNKSIRFPNTGKEYKVDVKELATKFYSTLPTEKIYEIYEVYRDDFTAFDYAIPNYIDDIVFKRTKEHWVPT